MTTESDRFNRLPKWAQEEITLLQMRLAEVNKAFADAHVPVGPESQIVVNPYSDHKFALTGRPNVVYHLQGVQRDRAGDMHIRHLGNAIEVMFVADRGATSLVVVPGSGNVVRLKQGE